MTDYRSQIGKLKTENWELRTHGGVTLVELILYVALFMIFITGVVTFGIQVIQLRVKSRVQQEVIFNSRMVAKRIAFEVRNASAINTVTAGSISLANSDSARNPTIIAKAGNRITISWGSAGPCPTATPCFLTSSEVSVSNLIFTNMSDAGAKSASIKYALTINNVNPGGRAEWNYAQTTTGNAELRSK